MHLQAELFAMLIFGTVLFDSLLPILFITRFISKGLFLYKYSFFISISVIKNLINAFISCLSSEIVLIRSF